MNKFKSFILATATLLFCAACGSNGTGSGGFADEGLNGTWTSKNGDAMILNNGIFTGLENNVEVLKGTYTTDGSTVTITVTQIYGSVNGGKSRGLSPTQWYTQEQSRAAFINYALSQGKTQAQANALAEQAITPIFAPQTGTYSGTTLTMDFWGERETFTNPNAGSGGGLSSQSGDGGSNIIGPCVDGTVKIGTQVWQKCNSNYAAAGSKCYGEGGQVVVRDYNSNKSYKTLSDAEIQANCEKYGRLYNWATAMALPDSCNKRVCENQIQPKHQGICPSGWHIPSSDEWSTLKEFVGLNAGKKLKAKNGWNNSGYNILGTSIKPEPGTDDFGFAALPGGQGYDDHFEEVGDEGSWWSTGGWYLASVAYGWYITYIGGFYEFDYNKSSNLFSVRCVQD